VDIEEFTRYMRPAASLNNPSASEQLIEPSIAVSLNDAAQVVQMDPRVLALAVG
jgi:hypothetical protein